MYKIVTSNAGHFRHDSLLEGSAPAMTLEKRSADLSGQLDWMANLGRVDPRVVQWIRQQNLDFDRHVYVLVVPLGADESWEQTSNGDAFERQWLEPENPEWGHKSFEHHANAFLNHRNSDPSRGFGDVPFTCYHRGMDRVEGVWRLDRRKADKVGTRDVVERIARNGAASLSMGCFPAGTRVTLEDGSSKPIEDIRVGDLVLTAKGRARRVTEVHARPWRGHLSRVSVQGQVEDIFCTPDHPFLGAKKDDVVPKHRWVDAPEADWLHAGCLTGGDYVTLPAAYEPLTPDYATPALARLLGYYLAEGHLCRNKRGEIVAVEFTCHREDALVSEIGALCAELGTRNEPVYRERTNSEAAASITIHDRGLAELCLRHCGAYSTAKQVDTSLFSWEPDLLRHFIGAYFNGDGCQPVGTYQEGAGYLSTASRQLAEQIVLILARLGIPTSINYIHHKGGKGFSSRDTFEHQIRIGKRHISKLAPYCKAEPYEASVQGGQGRRVFGDRMWARVNEVVESPIEFEGTVYNFEVEEDESYLISGVCVHNCRVPFDVCTLCANKARTVREYCSHVRDPGFGAILPDGRLMRVLNPRPKFFDLSDVRVPAAPESLTLMLLSPEFADIVRTKTSSGARFVVPSSVLAAARYGQEDSGLWTPAHYKVSHSAEPVKLAEIVKRAPVLDAEIIRPMQEEEPEISVDVLKSSGVEGLPVPAVLSTLAGLGIVLSPREVCAVHEACTGQRVPVPPVRTINQAWTRSADDHPHLQPGFFSPSMAESLKRLVPQRSVLYPHLCSRIASTKPRTFRGDVYGEDRDTGERVTVGIRADLSGVEEGMAEYIASYLRAMSMQLGKFLSHITATYPSHESHCLGAGLLTGGRRSGDAVGATDYPTEVAFPSAYILSRAGRGSDPQALMASIDALHYPGMEHLFGGMISP